ACWRACKRRKPFFVLSEPGESAIRRTSPRCTSALGPRFRGDEPRKVHRRPNCEREGTDRSRSFRKLGLSPRSSPRKRGPSLCYKLRPRASRDAYTTTVNLFAALVTPV